MKKIIFVPHEYLKVLWLGWLSVAWSCFFSLAFLYGVKNWQGVNQENNLTINYVINDHWQSIYSKLLINLVEEVAQENWEKAIDVASQIKPLAPKEEVTAKELETKLKQWDKTLEYLENIPVESSLINQVNQKKKEYKSNREFIDYQLENYYSQWVETLAENSPIAKANMMITICDFLGVCRRFQGNKAIKSPASLIKIPVAVAVMKKVKTEQVKLMKKIKVIRGNFTEDASDIIVGNEYPLKHLLFRMINQSSNIATNQLIDYVGWKNMNETLQKNIYNNTYIGFKVVGERTYPTNPGCCTNRMTTDELTQMMIDIYTIKTPENEALIEFLAAQEDQTMGYDALQDKTFIWLGEKTGRHSRFKGTTVAAKIQKNNYIITVAITQGTADKNIANIVKKIATKIHKNGHLKKIK